MLPALLIPSPRRLAALSSAVLSGLLLLTPGVTQAQRPNAFNSSMHWVGTWGASPSSPTNNAPVSTHAYNGTNAFVNQTVRLIIHTSIGGGAVRIRLSNAFGTQAMNIGAAHVAVRDSAANLVAGTDRPLTFGGQPSLSLPPAADTLSDPVCLTVPALGDLAVSLYLPGNQTVTTVHELASQTSYVSPANGGDATAATTFPLDAAAPTTTEWQLLSGVEVYVPAATTAVATFGDSITDGYQSTLDANARWPNTLANRFQAAGMAIGVVDQGISGNRVLYDQFGPLGEARFERDVLVSGNVRWATDLLGINDIGFQAMLTPTQTSTADQIIAGKRQFIERAHAAGMKIYGLTLLPFGKASYYSAAGEAKRLAVNAFVRSGAYDGFVDFETVMGDGATPPNLKAAYDSGDGLHPNDAGYQVMGNAVPLSLFQ